MDPASGSPSQRFQYKPLDASRNEIRVLSFEPLPTLDDLNGHLDHILGLGLDPLRLKLEHVSLDDFKPEYITFRAARTAQRSRSRFDYELGSASSEVFCTTARFTWGDYTAISYMWGSPEGTKTITINGMPITVGENLAAALDCLRSSLVDKVWIDAVCINQDDIDERNAQVLRIRDIFSQSLAVTIWLGEDEMNGKGLDSWVETSFDELRLCNAILEAHGRQTLEAALGTDVEAWESDHNYDELEGFPFRRDVLYFNNEWFADSDDSDEFGPPRFRDLVTVALSHLAQNPYWTRLWIILELAVSPIRSTLNWGNSSVPLRAVLTLADIFYNKILIDGDLDSLVVARMSPYLQLLNSIRQWQKSGALSDKEDGLKGTAVDDLRRLAGSAQCTLPHDKVFGLLGLLPQAISSKITIDYKRDETELLSEFTVAICSANENSGNLEGAGDVEVQRTTVDSIYALQDLPGRGKGLVASKKISKGTRILSEEAIVTVSESVGSKRLRKSICKQVEALSENQRRDFLSMHNIHPYRNTAEQYLGIFRTNSLPAEAVDNKGAIFLEACRINHACDNNAQKNWNEKIKRHTVHALRDINEGEEITITYIGPLKNRKARQKVLQEKFDFTCLCHLCSLPPEQSQESDRRLEEIHRLDGIIDQLGIEGVSVFPLRTLRYFDRQVSLYIEHGREDVGLAQTFVNAAQLAIANSDLARGRVFAERAASVWKMTLGGDSKQAIKHGALAQDPSNYELFGISTKWKTKVNEVPQGLEPGDFEDWLWKREKPNHPQQLADLRSRTTFPRFSDLPDEYDLDPEFYETSNTGTYRPRRHWCFFGEIVDFGSLFRLQIEIKDADGTKIPLFFHTDGRGSELAPEQVQKGYTVVVLYAERHVFMSGETGIRHEDPQLIKIFPLSLAKLLVLNDQVQRFSTQINGMRICHGCGKKAASLQRCGKCSSFWYCNKGCQVVGWNEKGHKADCKPLRDPDLRGLFILKWGEFDNHIRFPLRAAEDS
ncbi:heterokaryon incompatibility protein-domain-containing protein [Xylariaceae sp. FL1651]|nr:heterokaryon incompatibility protein-domain-containing protein [Xylariaceae sp. FL1651]